MSAQDRRATPGRGGEPRRSSGGHSGGYGRTGGQASGGQGTGGQGTGGRGAGGSGTGGYGGRDQGSRGQTGRGQGERGQGERWRDRDERGAGRAGAPRQSGSGQGDGRGAGRGRGTSGGTGSTSGGPRITSGGPRIATGGPRSSGRPAGADRAGQGTSAGRPARAGKVPTGRGRAASAARTQTRPTRPPRTPEVTIDVHDPDGVRLQKVLAAAGLGSRRSCEELIATGRVTVDGSTVRELGVRVDPLRAVIHVDGLRVQLDTSMVTLALNKPLGVVSTMHDPDGRPSLAQFVADRSERLFHVGRLDAETEGLILLTNDGELANRLSHPSHGVPKTYLAHLDGRVPASLPARLKAGVELEDGVVTIDKFSVVQTTPQASLVEIVLHEGRNRVVRRIFEELGYPVTRLVRTQIGPVRLGDLRPGRTRVLGKTEVGSLMTRVGL
ncbi:hypothetical protein CSO01_09380 [Cellulomonas soli]|uniref:Pseudouridine synthase n=1 Tax=Cellulomonas soli TaxID=931535 RepID=A0A512PAJ2_9CELL|nr:hypothetical protein CSO01_09380 [Cellulomonas soli]